MGLAYTVRRFAVEDSWFLRWCIVSIVTCSTCVVNIAEWAVYVRYAWALTGLVMSLFSKCHRRWLAWLNVSASKMSPTNLFSTRYSYCRPISFDTRSHTWRMRLASTLNRCCNNPSLQHYAAALKCVNRNYFWMCTITSFSSAHI